jgi:hypothetical protein
MRYKIHTKRNKKSTENYGEHLFETYRNTLLGLDGHKKALDNCRYSQDKS